ncbi:unnamed protein product [Spirodela intermedia]|uniref:Uncharacterized protein n=2 Tax=Spirodela intermedia TaxID=51605 RepID=A0A7I8IJH4_SPIIN|nr:unnamed protein product [Spirodela intermedia]CAA6657298.1 unnamed protein product [Spirodela intermedia]CAA7393342.1 unnamed protein product [Spirodela intermedia]
MENKTTHAPRWIKGIPAFCTSIHHTQTKTKSTEYSLRAFYAVLPSISSIRILMQAGWEPAYADEEHRICLRMNDLWNGKSTTETD